MLQSRALAPLPPGVEERDGLFVDPRSGSVSFLDPRLPPGANKLTARLKQRRAAPAYVLDTHAKHQQLRGRLLSDPPEAGAGEDLVLDVRRERLVEDSRMLFEQPPEALRRPLKIRFVDEPGKDYGGMSAEWFLLLSRELAVLFRQTAAYEYVWDEAACSEELAELVGKLLGLTLLHARLVELPLAPCYYKFLLGQPVGLADLRAVDEEHHRSLLWMLDNDVTGLGIAYACGDVPLLPGGDPAAEVTEANKREYAEACARFKLVERDRELLEALARGFEAAVPLAALRAAALEPEELGLLLNGSAALDVADWRAHTVYLPPGTEEQHPVVAAFWAAVEGLSEADRRRLLRFATGTERVPCGGFRNLQASRFAVALLPGRSEGLPTAHTCFNRLELPIFAPHVLPQMRDLLLKAIECNSFEIE